MYFVFFNSNYLGHPDNYIPAMYMSTPAHIVPEWYFLPFYALLRSIPDKLGGVVVMLLSIVGLALLPVLLNLSSKRFILNSNFNTPRALFFSFFIANSLLLGWIGGQPIEEPMYTVGQYSSLFYFVLIFVIFPIMNTYLTIDLALKSNVEDQYNWWESLYVTFSDFLGLSLKLRRFIGYHLSDKYKERYDEFDVYYYERGDDTYFPDESWKSPEDHGFKGFWKNRFGRQKLIVAQLSEGNHTFVSERHLEFVDFSIKHLQWTEEKQANLEESLKKLLNQKIEYFNAFVPESIKTLASCIFAPTRAFSRTTDRIPYSAYPYKDKYTPFRLKSAWHPEVLVRLEKMFEEERQNAGEFGIFVVPPMNNENQKKKLSDEEIHKEIIKTKESNDQKVINFFFAHNPSLLELQKNNPSLSREDILRKFFNS